MARSKQNTDPLNSALQRTPIAVVGMTGVFPEAHNLGEYWDNILKGVDCIRDVPPSRWSLDDYYDPDQNTPDKTYCKRGGFLPELDFNPMEFGLPPNILEVTDVSQLLALVIARDLLDSSGYGESRNYDRNKMGIVLGLGVGQKLIGPLISRLQYPVLAKVLKSVGASDADIENVVEKFKKAYIRWEENSFPGMLGNVVAGRIANRLDLGGINCATDAACASSLAAVRLAVSELLEHRSEMMITGGVDTDNSIFMYLSFSKTPAFTTADRVQTFDAESKGMMVGEGIGMVLLKRLEDAERDKDQIFAVLRGIGASSDGKFKSIYAPRPAGQEKALIRAYEDAGINHQSIGLIEAHGTGTGAGDVSEFQALNKVFSVDNPTKQHIALGSVKSQIGHAKAAAGAAGFIKAVLALHHKVLPPTINVKQPNPKLNVQDSPFYINTESRPWITQNGESRRAGISAFGFGGTNFHIVLEEYHHELTGKRFNRMASPVLIHAETLEALKLTLKNSLDQLKGPDGPQQFPGWLENHGIREIPTNDARLGFVCDKREDAIRNLEDALRLLSEKADQDAWESSGIHFRKQGLKTSGKVVALFPGQGSQYLNMGRELANSFPDIQKAYEQIDPLFVKDGAEPLSKRVFPIPVFSSEETAANQDVLQLTQHAQPSIGTFSVGLFKILEKCGFKADFTAGHSFGELTALWAAGVLNDHDYFALARARGKAMAAPDDPNFDAGTMAAVMGSTEAIQAVINDFPNIKIANLNSQKQNVIAGPKQEVIEAQKALKKQGLSAVLLPVSAAFHTPLVGHAQKPFAEAIDKATFKAPVIPVYSNATGQAYPKTPKTIQKQLQEHILQSVRFQNEIENIYQDGGTIFVEIGPKNVLTKLVETILKGKEFLAIALNPNPKKDSDSQLREAVVQLSVAGFPLHDFDPFQPTLEPPKKTSPVSVKLSGNNYVSPATSKAFEDALKDGYRLQGLGKIQQSSGTTEATPQVIKTPSSPVVKAPVAAPVQPPQAVVAKPSTQVISSPSVSIPSGSQPAMKHTSSSELSSPQTVSNGSPQLERVIDSIEHSLSHFYTLQSETLRVHEKYLESPREYSRTFLELMKLQTTLVQNKADTQVISNMEHGMDMFHNHQGETLRVHEQYLHTQADHSRSALELMREQYNAVAHSIGMPQSGTTLVSTPAPRLEHRPAAQPQIPVRTPVPSRPAPVPPVAPSAPVVTAPKPVQAPAPKAAIPQSVQKVQQPPTPVKPVIATAPAAPSKPGVDAEQLTKTMLSVVSQKTGYPTEMLELGMDMEADLGIDSIKRVEILGTVQDQFPQLPQINPEELAELRTLGQIVDKMKSFIPAGGSSVSVAAPVARTASIPASPASTTGAVNLNQVTDIMLKVVSAKTGYPVEMLELGMDMEADLGIDSIKRVEILGTVQDQIPGLPEMKQDEMAELRTLGQIIDYMRGRVPQAPSGTGASVTMASSAPVSASTSSSEAIGIDPSAVTHTMLKVVSEKTGYPVEMLELDMDMEADLGIDSIKRVEILGTVQDRLPGLPEFNQESLAELRTLGQIVEYMKQQTSSAGSSHEAPVKKKALTNLVPCRVARLQNIPNPDYLPFTGEGQTCLLTHDGTPLTAELARILQEQGWDVCVLIFPESMVASPVVIPREIPQVVMSETGETAIINTLQLIRAKTGTIQGMIHLNPIQKSVATIEFSDTSRALLLHVFLLAKHIKDDLNHTRSNSRNFFMTVVRLDGRLGLAGPHTSIIEGGIAGISKTAMREWPDVFCRTVDLHPELSVQQAASFIMAEMHDPDLRLMESGYTSKGRATILDEVVSEIQLEPTPGLVTASSVFLVSGGAKGVTAECAIQLAQNSKCKLILIGRSNYSANEPEWAKGCDDVTELKRRVMEHLKSTGDKPTPAKIQQHLSPVLSGREIRMALTRIQQAGGQAEYISGDVTNAVDLKQKIDPIVKKWGAITGLIHGAGVLADKWLEKKTIKDFEAVYSTKIDGLKALLSLVEPNQLQHLVMFSSAAGFYGNPGQVDYSVANEILNKTAWRMKQQYPKCHVITFNWGPWDGGMVTPELKRMFTQKQVYIIPLDHGSQLFAQCLTSANAPVQIIVGSSMQSEGEVRYPELRSWHFSRKLRVEANVFTKDHVIGGNQVLPTVSVIAWMADACEQIYPGFTFFRCDDYTMFKGVVFDETLADEYFVDLRETLKTPDEIDFEVKIQSLDSKGNNRVNYGAKIKLVRVMPERAVYQSLDLTRREPVDGNIFYQNGTLFHGPLFQSIEEVLNLQAEKLTMRCKAVAVNEAVQGQFPVRTFDPFSADVQFQAMLIWARHFYDAASLPSRAGIGEHYLSVPAGATFYVSLDIRKHSASNLVADITVHDENGLIYTRVINAEVTLSKQLNRLFVPAGSKN
ncbi:MAG: SDR family NAD(P)-dependent oxidoreductase [SAR324 cluster bacterium]|nr:SDR family NAD(P)-dependent oxidoreductase [SAR324 cluster bacterium]